MTADPHPIPVRLRPDLKWSRYSGDNDNLWIAQNPIDREFYFFSSIERSIALCLDGRSSVKQILQKVSGLDASITMDFVQQLVRRLDNASLLLHRNWTGRSTLASTSGRWLGTLSSWMAWRVPLFDPTGLTRSCEWLGSLLFAKWFVFGVFVVGVLATFQLGQRWPELAQDAMAFQSSLRGDRVLLLAVLMLVIKGMHEMGHALACRVVGAKCNEVGIMFLLGTPCLYCDVSDTWRVPQRWKRMMVSAAGMYIELLIALIAAAVWYVSIQPWLRGVSVQIMLLCSVVTIVFNANPLLRYDGYYILSDWLQIPNLSQQAQEAWASMVSRWFVRSERSRLSGQDLWLATYHVASWTYRWSLLLLVIWGINAWFFQRRLGEFGYLLTALMMVTVLANIVLASMRLVRHREKGTTLRWVPVSLLLVLCIGLVYVGAAWPLPQSVLARGVLEAAEFSPIYVRQSGTVQFVAQHGGNLDKGGLIAEIKSPELELEILKTSGELEATKVRLEQLAKRAVDDPLAAQQSAEVTQYLQEVQARNERLQTEKNKLNLIAPTQGRFALAESNLTKQDLSKRQFRNAIALDRLAKDHPTVERGEVLGTLMKVERWNLKAYVGEQQIRQCKVGAHVRVRVDQIAGRTLSGVVRSISLESLSQTPKGLMGDSLFAAISLDSIRSKPEQTTYAVSIELDENERDLLASGLATARIESEPQTLFELCRKTCSDLLATKGHKLHKR